MSDPTNCGSGEHFAFSPGGHDFALTTPDGRLFVWDATVGQVKHEFVPSAHLSAACCCLAWMPLPPKSPQSARKRKTSTSSLNDPENRRSDTIALGTTTGTLLIFSMKTGDATVHLSKRNAPHKARVNGVAWNAVGTEVFTASNDGFVARVSVRKSVVSDRFQCFSPAEPLHSLCLHPSGSSLLLGSATRVAWLDLDTGSVLRTFEGGHVGRVSVLAVFGDRLVSAGDSAQKDHVLTVWKLSLDEDETSKLAVNESIRTVFSDASSSSLAAVTSSGVLTVFRVPSTTKRKSKPAKATKTVRIATGSTEDGHVGAIPILDARFASDDAVVLAHGSMFRPTFETLKLGDLDKSSCLVRAASSTSSEPATKGSAKTSSSLVVPGFNGTRILSDGGGGSKRKAAGDSGGSVSMVDRLRLLSRDADQKTTPPRADSMIQLLLQGLRNGDRRILDSVLDRADDDLIRNTVTRLPVEAIVPLIEELQRYVKGRGMVNQSHSLWLESTLRVHAAHLMSSPRCHDLLGPIYAMLEARTKHYSSLMQLKGKLDVMTRQIATKVGRKEGRDEGEKEEEEEDREALLVYQDNSGDDEISEAMDDLLLPPSDTDDNWMMEDEDEEGSGAEDTGDSDDVNLVAEVNGEADEDMVSSDGS